ncbi:MAG: hypothetical protein KDA74_13475, partial [Planctomycetaceae bacterium]|nr:hypothetical protein [Planctomycetaceae bacterium]
MNESAANDPPINKIMRMAGAGIFVAVDSGVTELEHLVWPSDVNRNSACRISIWESVPESGYFFFDFFFAVFFAAVLLAATFLAAGALSAAFF